MKLFVERKVINNSDVHDWFKKQDIKGLILPEEYHVTVAYSRASVDLSTLEFDQNNIVIDYNPYNDLDIFNDYLVQTILTDIRLFTRFHYFKNMGCSFDYPVYSPHISIAEGYKNTNIDEILPYQGPIILGPEIYEELNLDFSYERDT